MNLLGSSKDSIWLEVLTIWMQKVTKEASKEASKEAFSNNRKKVKKYTPGCQMMSEFDVLY